MRIINFAATIAALILSASVFAATPGKISPACAYSPDAARINEAMNNVDQKAALTLIQKGSGINGCDKEGHTPLSKAASLGERDLAERLLERGANIDQRIHGDLTPLMIAVSATYLEVVKLLIEKGAAIDLPTGYNHTALRFACDTGKDEISQYLVKKGANIRALGADNKIAGWCLLPKK